MPSRPLKSVSSEDTFAEDLPLDALGPAIESAARRVWEATRRKGRAARTVTLKLKTAEFRIVTRRRTLSSPPESLGELVEVARELTGRVELPPSTRFRLAGVGLSAFVEEEETGEISPQPGLFDDSA